MSPASAADRGNQAHLRSAYAKTAAQENITVPIMQINAENIPIRENTLVGLFGSVIVQIRPQTETTRALNISFIRLIDGSSIID